MTVGERIKKVREKTGMSQVDFANKINVSKQTLYKYENNLITNIPSDKIEAVAEIGGVSPAYLMGWEDDTTSVQDNYPPYVAEIASHIYRHANVIFEIYMSSARNKLIDYATMLKLTLRIQNKNIDTIITGSENSTSNTDETACTVAPINKIQTKAEAIEFLKKRKLLAAFGTIPDQEIVNLANILRDNEEK